MKYKVGDRVRVRRDFEDKLYFMDNKTGSCYVTTGMLKLRGRVVTIKEASPSCYRIAEYPYFWTDDMFEGKVNDKKIVIVVDGAETLANLYEDGKVVKRATAKCSPDDKFDFGIGAQLAFERLMDTTPKKKDEYYNGKVVCIRERTDLTVGKIYEFIHGQLKDNVGDLRPTDNKIKSLDESWVTGWFIPLVEETKGE